jgi:hypothetical protein
VDFELTEEQAALREVSRAMLAANCPPSLVRSLAAAGQDVDDKLWQRGTELGWTGWPRRSAARPPPGRSATAR